MAEKRVYLNFPISMIPPIYKDEDINKAIERIVCYGFYSYCIGKGLGLIDAFIDNDFQISENYDAVSEYAKNIYNAVSDNTPPVIPFSSIAADKARSLMHSRKSYKCNRDEILSLCGELAIRSIVGRKEYSRCSRGLVLSRMAGFAKVMGEESFPEEIKRLSGDGGKRQWRKMIASVKLSGCSIYAPKGCRGFYASFRLRPKQLAEMVEQKRREREPRSEYEMSNEDLRKHAQSVVGKGRTP